jgi:hypothetical protein
MSLDFIGLELEPNIDYTSSLRRFIQADFGASSTLRYGTLRYGVTSVKIRGVSVQIFKTKSPSDGMVVYCINFDIEDPGAEFTYEYWVTAVKQSKLLNKTFGANPELGDVLSNPTLRGNWLETPNRLLCVFHNPDTFIAFIQELVNFAPSQRYRYWTLDVKGGASRGKRPKKTCKKQKRRVKRRGSRTRGCSRRRGCSKRYYLP